MVYAGLSALVGQLICPCLSICLSIITYRLSVLYKSVYTRLYHFYHSGFCSVLPYTSFVIFIAAIIGLSKSFFTCPFIITSFAPFYLYASVSRFIDQLSCHTFSYNTIYIQGSSRHLIFQKLVRCMRADISSERAARACERVSIASERKEQKTHTTTYIRGSFLHQRPPRNIACERLDSSTNERLAHASE